jgi:hypothetical protein
VAVFDLPLCGSRRSDKLSELVLDAGADAARLLRPELELQLASDLSRGLDVLEEDPSPPSSIAYVGVGLGADLATLFCEREARLRAFVLAADPASAVVVDRTPEGDRSWTLPLSSTFRRLAEIAAALRPLL